MANITHPAKPDSKPSNKEEEEPPWLTIAKLKQATRINLIKPYLQPLSSAEQDIIDIPSTKELSRRIFTGELTSHSTALAYIKRASHTHQKTNCLTEILFSSALEQASQLDKWLSQHGKTIGPLHGIPMTLKDQFNVEDFDTTLGYVGLVEKPAERDAVLVEKLKGLGAVILAKTNLPQSIMWCETENPLWGLTTHPRDSRLTPGGSTGGEGALLAEKGSLVGWGTDIGGSIRIPAHMGGLYGFKPSSGRLPYSGVQVSTSGQEHVPSVIGPLGRDLTTIHDVTKIIIEAQTWQQDPTVHPLPWQSSIYAEIQSRPLIIGILLDDGHVKPHPPISRVLKEAATKLEAAGHTLIPFPADGHTECISIMDAYYTADGGEDIRTSVQAGGEPFLPHVEALINRGSAISVYEYWALNRRKREAQAKYCAEWNSIRDSKTGRNVDVLIMPTMPHSAVPHRCCRWVGYTKVWNLLDYTALVVPFGKVDGSVDVERESVDVRSYEPRNEADAWNWGLYDPVNMNGLPLSVQIVGRRLEEEKVLGAGRVIEEVLRA